VLPWKSKHRALRVPFRFDIYGLDLIFEKWILFLGELCGTFKLEQLDLIFEYLVPLSLF
jgi:hypothetical protein